MTRYILIACVAFLAGWLANGWRLGEDIALMEKEQAQAIAQAQSEARKTEARLSEINENLQKELNNEKAQSKKRIDQLVDDVNAGRMRLKIAVSGCPEGTASGPGETRAELDPEVAESLIRIANDGDDAIRELNYCIDAYNSIRSEK